ncbi:class I SAM-dependent methyltransferase [Pelagibacteraceae bacterium]|nr:class I SAM-dependent methyltransferase [Pelagibacteraceae bacterium]
MICKISKKKMNPFMSFGQMPIANGFIEEKNFNKEYFYNMEVGFSEDLSLFQLNDHPKPESMFNDAYPFFSGSSSYMQNHFKNYADFVKNNFLKNSSRIIEIGSNDGTLLKNFLNENNKIIGFEPSKNVALKAQKENIPTINNFFNIENVKNLTDYLGKTDVVCASNVICHIPDLDNLIKSVDLLLSQDGTFIFEEPYLGSMFEKTSYDQIYDEHIYMFSISSIVKIFSLYDLQLVDVLPQITHGGSMRYIVKRKKKKDVSLNIKKMLEREKINKIDSIESCLSFKKNCETSKDKINERLKNLKMEDKKICGYAATSKSTTILNYCNIDTSMIDFICDTTEEKIGKFSPGKHIPIVDMNYFYKNLPHCIYLFAWNHKEEIFKKENSFKGEWFSHVAL